MTLIMTFISRFKTR